MSSKNLILLVILIIVLVCVAVYFFYFEKLVGQEPIDNTNQLAEVSLEQMLEFKSYDESLSAAVLEKYQQQFEAAKEIILNNPSALSSIQWLVIARLKKYVKDYAGAEKIYLYLISLDIHNYIHEGNLADLYANYLNDYDKAAEHYWRALEKAKETKFTVKTSYWDSLASIYAERLTGKRNEFEKKAMETLAEEFREDVNFYSILAKYYRDIGQQEKAIELLEQALELAPGNAAIIEEIERLKSH